ncbi:MAG: hydrogenase nickel incorporation protein HypB [Cytophagales bacterium]
MCATCGCDSDKTVTLLKPGTNETENHHHHHEHTHDHHHDHEHFKTDPRELILERDVLMKNDLMAERNRGYFEAKNIMTFNLVSSPGSGKTTILEKTILKLSKDFTLAVIEGDQQSSNDAERISATGIEVIQINTGKGCHLDSEMVNRALKKLNPSNNSILFIENVGNLVCPALFDLGEGKRVVIISTTEGEDKPLKYPFMFESSEICIINKTDLLPYLDFDMEKLKDNAKRINPDLTFFELSATKGDGMDEWCHWLKDSMLVSD